MLRTDTLSHTSNSPWSPPSNRRSPSIGQDCDKTLEIYREFLYPVMRRQRIKHLVEDNVSPHNLDKIRTVHQQQRITIVGYEATEEEKREIVRLITDQTRAYRLPQDRQAQITKQTSELHRLPV